MNNEPSTSLNNLLYGLTFAQCDQFIERHGGRTAFRGLITSTVVEKVKADTLEVKQAYVTFLLERTPLEMKKATVFISHMWKANFLDGYDLMKSYFQERGENLEDIVIWHDIFCVNQHIQHKTHEEWVLEFSNPIKTINRVVLLLSKMNDEIPFPLERSWCKLEYITGMNNKVGYEIAVNYQITIADIHMIYEIINFVMFSQLRNLAKDSAATLRSDQIKIDQYLLTNGRPNTPEEFLNVFFLTFIRKVSTALQLQSTTAEHLLLEGALITDYPSLFAGISNLMSNKNQYNDALAAIERIKIILFRENPIFLYHLLDSVYFAGWLKREIPPVDEICQQMEQYLVELASIPTVRKSNFFTSPIIHFFNHYMVQKNYFKVDRFFDKIDLTSFLTDAHPKASPFASAMKSILCTILMKDGIHLQTKELLSNCSKYLLQLAVTKSFQESFFNGLLRGADMNTIKKTYYQFLLNSCNELDNDYGCFEKEVQAVTNFYNKHVTRVYNFATIEAMKILLIDKAEILRKMKWVCKAVVLMKKDEKQGFKELLTQINESITEDDFITLLKIENVDFNAKILQTLHSIWLRSCKVTLQTPERTQNIETNRFAMIKDDNKLNIDDLNGPFLASLDNYLNNLQVERADQQILRPVLTLFKKSSQTVLDRTGRRRHYFKALLSTLLNSYKAYDKDALILLRTKLLQYLIDRIESNQENVQKDIQACEFVEMKLLWKEGTSIGKLGFRFLTCGFVFSPLINSFTFQFSSHDVFKLTPIVLSLGCILHDVREEYSFAVVDQSFHDKYHRNTSTVSAQRVIEKQLFFHSIASLAVPLVVMKGSTWVLNQILPFQDLNIVKLGLQCATLLGILSTCDRVIHENFIK